MIRQILLLVFSLMSLGYAGVQSDLNGYFNEVSYANINGPSATSTQQAYYMTGGSGYIRNPVKNLQPANIQLPSVNAACGGINLFTGGFSFINSDNLSQFGQAVMQNAPTFALQIALETFNPMIAKTVQTFLSWAQMINDFNMSSCEALQYSYDAIKGVMKDGIQQTYACSTFAQETGQYADWLKGSQECKKPDVAKSNNDSAKSAPKIKDLVKQNRNIVWYAMMQNSYLAANTEVAELLMSFSGTIIFGDKVENKKIFPQLIKSSDSSSIKAMLYGGNLEMYKCSGDVVKNPNAEGCLSMVSDRVLVVSNKDSLTYKISLQLQAIGQKFKDGTGMSSPEKNLTETSGMSIVTYIMTQIEAGSIPPYSKLADIVARKVLTGYLRQLIKIIRYSITVKSNSGDTEEMKWLLDNLETTSFMISRINSDVQKELNLEMQMDSAYKKIMSEVAGQMSSDTASWINAKF